MALMTVVIFVVFWLNRTREGEVLGLISPVADPLPEIITPVSTPSATPMASPSASISPIEPEPLTEATPSATPTPKSKPEPTITPAPASSQEVNGYIERFSSQYGVDPNVIRHIAICESGFNSNAVSLSYVGLFQFGPATWENIRKEIGEDPNTDLRYSAEESVQTASYAVSKGKGKIWPNCFPN